MALVDGRAHHGDDRSVALLAPGDGLGVALPPHQRQHAGEELVHVHAAALVVREALDEDAHGHDAQDEQDHHQPSAALNQAEDVHMLVDRSGSDLGEGKGHRGYQRNDLASATTVSPRSTVKRQDETGPWNK